MMAADVEQAIRQAIIDKFFEPTTLILSHPTFNSQTGQTEVITYPSQTEAPALKVGRAIWEANAAAITKAVMDRLDIDAIVEQTALVVTKAVVEHLTAQPAHSWSANPTLSERQKMLNKVYDQVADEFGRQCVEHLRTTGGLMGVLDAPREEP